MMKEMTGGVWDGYHPVTNVLVSCTIFLRLSISTLKACSRQWLHYLLRKLLSSKGLKPPGAPRKIKAPTQTSYIPSSETSFSEKDCYECLVDIENWLGQSIASVTPRTAAPTTKGKNGRKTQTLPKAAVYSGPMRAGEIVAYGVKKEWIKATRLY